ncbi:hypothetical protein [Ulvibacterium sp.]|uniref:hypothetical protein n=1 Tax=Ulvibacterium sp. TaxID=2665914 RepID=UPI003CC54D6A
MSAALIFIFNCNLEISARQAVQSDLIDLCESCIDFYLSDSENFVDFKSEKQDLFDNGLICEFSKKRWGSYTKLTVKAFFKKDTIQKSAFVGPRGDKDMQALVVCDWDKPLKVSGSTIIKGNMKIPATGYKIVNILGNNQLNKPILKGSIARSSQLLPEISMPIPEGMDKTGTRTGLSKIDKRHLVYNGFGKRPLIIELEKGEQLNSLSFKGNIVIKSVDTLYISSSTKIEDVIVQAPKIIIGNGFEGRAQFFAANEIFVEEEVLLAYPSSLVVTSGDVLSEKKITLSEDSRVYGGIAIHAATFDEKEKNKMIVHENALVMGTLYCNGKLQLEGHVLGTVYAHKLQLETKSGTYDDVLLNVSIDALNVPKGFIHLPLFKQQEKNTYGIIKTL